MFEDDKPKLLPCPFCGGKAEYNSEGFMVYCIKCRAGVKVYAAVFPYEAVAVKWNTRTHRTVL